MKRTTVHVVAAGLLLSGASLIQAQSPEPSHLIRIFREDIKSGKGSAHEKVESAYVRAFSKSGYPSYLALENMTGTNQAWFIERYDTYEAMGNAIHLAETEPLKTTLTQLDAQDGELRSGERGMIAVYQKDLSYLPVPPLGPKARFYTISMVRVRPGHTPDYAEMRKLTIAAMAKAGIQRRYLVYSVNSGAPAGTYLVLSAVDSLKSMDTPASAMSMAEAYGADNLARYYKLQSDIVISSESTMFTINPKMSNPPKEYIAADAGFWAPKPKPAAAKPAATPAATPTGQQ
ncbi:MAG: hypothetical protein ABSC05_29070 [Candidatus Solibacter sp.]|jgi:hypothetical protein